MGLQEYFVTKRNHTEQEFMDTFGSQFVCVSLVKKEVTGIDFPELPRIDEGTELVVLYGDRYDLRDELKEKFSDEIFLGTEFVNKAAFGCWFPTEEQMHELFEDRTPNSDDSKHITEKEIVVGNESLFVEVKPTGVELRTTCDAGDYVTLSKVQAQELVETLAAFIQMLD